MVYRMTADLLMVVHLLWIVWLVCGALVAYKYPWMRAVHLGGLAFSVTMQVCGWYCPLTILEQWLRLQHHPEQTYVTSFIAHYAECLVYLQIPPLLVLGLTLVVCVGTGYIYLTWPQETTPYRK